MTSELVAGSGGPTPGPVPAAVGAASAPVSDTARPASELAAALNRDGPTVIDASVDPVTYPDVMDLTRGEAGRRLPPTGP